MDHIPADDSRQAQPELRVADEEATASFDLEEIRRRLAGCKAGQGRTTEQVLARLRALQVAHKLATSASSGPSEVG
jgi:hypothetical protein